MDNFLREKQGEGTSEPGEFTLNEERAKEMTLSALRLQPENFPKHLLAVAYLGQASRVVACSPRGFLAKWASLASGKRRVSFSFSFDGSPLSLSELERIPASLLLHTDRRLQRFSFVFHQLKELSPQWFRFTSWDVDRIHNLTWKRGKLHCHTRPNPTTQVFKKGMLVETHLPTPLANLTRQALEDGALWSPLECLYDDVPLRSPLPPTSTLHVKPSWESQSPPARLTVWLDPFQGPPEVFPVTEGLTLSPVRPKMKTPIPGLKIVISGHDLTLDASRLNLVQDDKFRSLLESALKRSEAMVLELAQSTAPDCRHYLLRHWQKFQHLGLEDSPLLKDRNGDYHCLREIWRVPQAIALLEPEDAQFARQLMGIQHYYRFLRGGNTPRQTWTNRRGSWSVAIGDSQPLVIDLGAPGTFHRAKHPYRDSPDWHPEEPWLAYISDRGATVWDAKLQKELMLLKGPFSRVQFSHYGRYLHLFTQDSSHRILYRKLSTDGFQQLGLEVELPGFNPCVLDSLLLAWVNPNQFEIRDFCNLSRRIDEFFTEECLDRLLDISPNRRYALLGGPRATYLLDTEQRTLQRLPVQLEGALFSWDSDKIIGLKDRQLLLYDLRSGLTSALPSRNRLAVFRSGLALQCPEERHRASKWELLFQPHQHKLGLAHRDARVVGTTERFPRWYLARSQSEPIPLWRTGRGQVRLLSDRSKEHSVLAWEGPSGCYLYTLQGDKHPTKLLPGCTLIGNTLARTDEDQISLVAPDTGQVETESLQLGSKRVRVDHRATYLQLELDNWCAVESRSGRLLYSGTAPVTQVTREWICWRSGQDYWFSLLRSGRTGVKVNLSQVDHLHLHPRQNTALMSRRGYCSLIRLHRIGFRVESPLVPGRTAKFSPDGQFYMVIHQSYLRIYQYPSLQQLCRFPIQDGVKARWLCDNSLLVGEEVWWTHPSEQWRHPHLTNWEFPPSLFVLPDTRLAVDVGGTEARFFELTSGRIVAYFRPLAEHWFAFTPEGQWEGSSECCRYLSPKPVGAPVHGLLRKLVQKHDWTPHSQAL